MNKFGKRLRIMVICLAMLAGCTAFAYAGSDGLLVDYTGKTVILQSNGGDTYGVLAGKKRVSIGDDFTEALVQYSPNGVDGVISEKSEGPGQRRRQSVLRPENRQCHGDSSCEVAARYAARPSS